MFWYIVTTYLQVTCEQVLHAPTVQIWDQSSTILPPTNLLIVCLSSITIWSQNTMSAFGAFGKPQEPPCVFYFVV